MAASSNLDLVCPVYNEAENIEALVETLSAQITTPFRLMVIYDHDDDTTLPVLERVRGACPFPIVTVKNRYGRGALNAVKTGLQEAKADAVLVIMADLADDLSIVDALATQVLDEGSDVACGSRYMREGQQIGGPLMKGLLSRLAGLSLHFIAGLPTHDATNNFKMYSRRFLSAVTVESSGGFEIALELVVKAFLGGYRVTEVPSVWRDRVAGSSRFRLMHWLPHYLRWYLKAMWGKRSRQRIMPIADLPREMGNTGKIAHSLSEHPL
ncbi:MAG TPA: glycosyltransferase [Candidatus Baltobacteraceae bacterium]|jgi:glycosyltransferase involved in cell wall biosynthesis|nr:glycosyltransferase [Candidatus Baltobacteraceae bacterium]